jgi:uncharacterized protein YndB with AHSA1/START domain
VLDLEQRYAEERERRRVVVGQEDAAFTLEQALPVPPPVAWEFLTAPDRRLLWQGAKVEEVQAGGRRSTGTWSVCVDGRTRIYEEILDWRPFDYFTERVSLAGGTRVLLTHGARGRRHRDARRHQSPSGRRPAPRLAQGRTSPPALATHPLPATGRAHAFRHRSREAASAGRAGRYAARLISASRRSRSRRARRSP